MNIGLTELSILGVLAIIILGGAKLKNNTKSKKSITKKVESNTMANFQNINSDYDNTPIKKEKT